jgi:hypothetical protein
MRLNALRTQTRNICFLLLALLFLPGAFSPIRAQTRRSVFQTGEELVYKVKYGFVKLGTVVMQTGSPADASHLNARMRFWTADVPFLDTKSLITDVIDTHAVNLFHFEENLTDHDKHSVRTFVYDPATKVLTISGSDISTTVIDNVRPFSDALTLFYNLRTWSASNSSYSFPMRELSGEKLVTCKFTSMKSKQECPAFEDKEIETRVLNGHAAMGNNTPLGADGDFTMYVTDDAAAIPIRIDLKIAIGSISLVLDKVKRTGWTP